MSSKEDILNLCFTVGKLPASFDNEAVTSLLKKHKSKIGVVDLQKIQGGEAEEDLEKWIVRMNTEDDATKFHQHLKQVEEEMGGEHYMITFNESTLCEIPEEWISSDNGDLETDSDREQKPKMPEKPKLPPSSLYDPPSGNPSMHGAQPFAASGFYHDVHVSQGQRPMGPYGPGQGFSMGVPRFPTGRFPMMPQPGQVGMPPFPPEGPQQPGPGPAGMIPMFDPMSQQWFYPPPGGFPTMPPGNQGNWTGPENKEQQGDPPPYSRTEMEETEQTNVKQHLATDVSKGASMMVSVDGLSEEAVDDPVTKILVSNLPGNVDEDFLEMFFENKKKSGGGKIASLELNKGNNTAIIEFQEAEAVQRVLENEPSLKIKYKKIRVELYQQEVLSDAPQDEYEEEPLTKIKVSKLPGNVDGDYLEMFFENTKMFGGGEVVNIEMDVEEATAIVEFQEPEAVQKVLKKQPITLQGAEIDVEIFRPEVVRDIAEDLLGGKGNPCKLLVTDLPEKADSGFLEMFFENKKKMGDLKVVNIEMYEEYPAALVEFSSSEDVETVLSKQPILVYKIEVGVYPYNPRRLPQNIIEVQGPVAVMDGDLLEMYFENTKKSGGDTIEDIRLKEETDAGGVAFIQFQSEEVALRVVRKGSHKISKKELLVKLYEPPDPLTEFLKQKYGTAEEQNATGASGTAAGKNKSESEPEQKTTSIVKVRGVQHSKSMDTIQFYFESTRRSGGGPIQDLKHDDDDNNVLFITFESTNDAERVVEKGSHKVHSHDLTVALYHPPVPRPVYEEKLLVKGLKHTTTKDCLFNYLESESGGSIPDKEQKGERPGTRLVTFKDKIDFDRLLNNLKPLEGANLTIERVTVSNCIYVSNYDESHGKDTLEFYFENTKRSGGGQIDKITFDPDRGFWLIYFNDYQVIDHVLSMQHSLHGKKLVVKLFVECLGLPEGDEAQTPFKCPDPILLSHAVPQWGQRGFEIRGNEKGVNQAKTQTKQLASKVQSRDHTVKKTGLGQFMTTQQGRDVPKAVESQLPCVIIIKGHDKLEDRRQEDRNSGGGRSSPQPEPSLPANMKMHAVCHTPDDRQIFTAEGDMTYLRLDALVNTADKKLSLAGGLGKIISRKGGEQIKDSCARYIQNHDVLNEGDVFVSPGGNLNVRHVIHVVGPAWQSGKQREGERLKEAVTKVMKQATLNNASSIAFPAIGCGFFGFPAKVATTVIVQAIQNHFREDQDSSVKVVYLCDVKSEAIQGFNDALKQCFGRVKIMSSSAQRGPEPSVPPKPNSRFKGTGVPAVAGYGGNKVGKDRRKKLKGTESDNSMTFTIYAMTQQVITQAIDKLEFMLDSGVIKKEFKNDIITKFDQDQESYLMNLAMQQHVDIRMFKQRGTIEISGYTMQVMALTDEIHELFREIKQEAHKMEEAELIANLIQWYFIEITETGQDTEKYEKLINRKIEKAYRAQNKTVEFSDTEGIVYVVDFAKMEEYPKDNPEDSVQVIRIYLISNASFEPTATWDKMSDSENLRVVNLQAGTPEYTQMETKFKTSAGSNYTVTKESHLMNRVMQQLVDIRMFKQRGTIEISGYTMQVMALTETIHEFFHEIKQEAHKKEEAELIAIPIQWYFIEITETGQNTEKYEKSINRKIELAYRAQDKTVEFSDTEGIVYVLDFAKMEEYPKDNPEDSVQVIRIYLISMC